MGLREEPHLVLFSAALLRGELRPPVASPASCPRAARALTGPINTFQEGPFLTHPNQQLVPNNNC